MDWHLNLSSSLIEAALLLYSFELGTDFGHYGEGWTPGCDMDPEEWCEWRMSCDDCGSTDDYYMVTDAVWESVTSPEITMLCLGCLEARLGRPLVPMDFTDCPLNQRQGFCTSFSPSP